VVALIRETTQEIIGRMARQHEKLSADRRATFGKKVRQLRRDGMVPGNVYGLNMKPIPLTMDGREFINVHQRAGSTGVIDLAVNGADSLPVLVQEVQHDPPTSRVLHVSFVQVDLTKPVSALVPVFITGDAPAVELGAIVIQHINEVSVSALPDDIPESFVVDVSGLADFDHSLLVSDLAAPAGVTIESESDDLVVRAERPRVVEEETPEEDEDLEGEEGAEEGEEGAAEEESEE
jgi:large subunit ribosomal protein L25